jgi:hypothetical protein
MKAWAQIKVKANAVVMGPNDPTTGEPTSIPHPQAGRAGVVMNEPAAGQSDVRFDAVGTDDAPTFARVFDTDVDVLTSGS